MSDHDAVVLALCCFGGLMLGLIIDRLRRLL